MLLGPDRYGKEFDKVLRRPPTDLTREKDLEILLSFYTEDVMRAAEREVSWLKIKLLPPTVGMSVVDSLVV